MLSFLSFVPSMHELHDPPDFGSCVSPGQCTPPDTKYSRVIAGPQPGQQWNINGGFCGAFSMQHAALAFGAWISQDLVRKANKDSAGPHNMHGDSTLGYEVVPVNVADTATGLKLAFDEWDYTSAKPQAAAFKVWLKSHLVKGEPIVWFPICKGDEPFCPYKDACPNGGVINHVEPMWGIFSNHPLDDTTVYEDDWILHASDQDQLPYYRPMSTLEDSPLMEGNCKDAQPGFGRNEMYPCFDKSVTYGLAVKGLAVEGGLLPVSLSTKGASSEPNTRNGEKPTMLSGAVTVSGLTAGKAYTLYRFNSTANLPSGPPFETAAWESKKAFDASGSTWSYEDPRSFSSASATYYIAVEATSAAATVEAA